MRRPVTPSRTFALAVLTLAGVASVAPAQAVVAISGFNDATGVNSDPTPNSPYDLNNSSLAGQGASEPGWLGPWTVGSFAAAVRGTTTFEGDGAVFMAGTSQPTRTLAAP